MKFGKNNVEAVEDPWTRDQFRAEAARILEVSWQVMHSAEWRLQKQSAIGDAFSAKGPGMNQIFKIKGVVDMSPEALLQLLFDSPAEYSKWNPVIVESLLLERVDERAHVSYQVTAERLGGLVARRDFVVLSAWEEREGALVLANASVPHPAAPPPNTYISHTENCINMDELPQCTAVCPSYMLKIKREDKPLIAKIRRAGHLKGKAVVRLVNHDMIRDLLIPSGRPNKYPAVFPRSQFEEIKMKAKHLSIPEKVALLNEEEARRKEEEKECMRRRVALQDFDTQRVAAGPDIVDRVCDKTAQQANYALARAYELRQEQDDDVKKFNSVILQTKCHAIREAQVAEKKLIEKQLKEEETRLDDMMEQIRRKSIYKEDEKRKSEIEKRQEYVKRLINQIKDKEISKLLEAENVECESRKMQESNIQMQLEELEKRKNHIKIQEKIRKDLEEVNCQLKRFREMEKEDDKAYEIKLKELQSRRADEEEARELALKAQALAHNQAYAKLWCQQKKEHDLRDKLNDLHEQRIQDEIERRWRTKEQMAARKRFELGVKLKMGREAQIEDTRRMRALEMAREKQEYENVLKAQQDFAIKEDEKEKKRAQESEIYLKALLNQIREKEQAKIRERQQVQEEGVLMRLEANCHDRQVKTIMKKKVDQLRTQVPEIYVKQVERQLEKPSL